MERNRGIDLGTQRQKVLEAYLSLAELSGKAEEVLIADIKAIRANGKEDYHPADSTPESPPALLETNIQGMQITLDTERRTVRTSNLEIRPIPPKECFVLMALMQNPYGVVTPSRLVNQLWPEKPIDDQSAANLIKIYIFRVRKLLGATNEDPIVYNIHGVGYSLTPRI